jgi:hypothetical protein
VPRMDEAARAQEEAEYGERLARARRASRKARRTSLAASRLLSEVDRVMQDG